MYFLVGGRQSQGFHPETFGERVDTLESVGKKRAKVRPVPLPRVSALCLKGRHAECTSLKCVCECKHGWTKGGKK